MGKGTWGNVFDNGTAASRPAAADVGVDAYYLSTDTFVLSQSDGVSAWTDLIAFSSLTAALEALAPLTPAADRLPYFDSSSTAALATFTSQARSLLDDTSFAAMLVTLGAVSRTGGGLENREAHGNTGATETFDLANGNFHTATLDANSTFTFTGATSGFACYLGLELTQDGTGSRTVTWPGSVAWPGGSAPTLHTAAAAVDVLQFYTIDGGTAWKGFHLNPSSSVSFSYGSNASRVQAASFAGSSNAVARADHIHDGIATITSSASNTLGRGNFNIRGGTGVGVTATDSDGDGQFDTLTFSSFGGGGGGGGGTTVATDAIWDAAGDLAVGTGADTAAKLTKGSAGAHLAMSNGSVVWNAGTSFPGSPATNDRYYRTDIRGGMGFHYDGTRWLSDQMFRMTGPTVDAITTDSTRHHLAFPVDYDIWLHSWDIALYVTSSAVFVATLQSVDFEYDTAGIATKSTTGQTTSKVYHYTEAIGAAVTTTGGNVANAISMLDVFYDLTSGSGTLFAGCAIDYRLIAT